MKKSYGFVEVVGVVEATTVLDTMCKTANVNFVAWQRKLGGRLVTIIIEGEVAAIKEAVETVNKKAVASGILANPHPEVVRLIRSFDNAKNKKEGGNHNGSIRNDRDEGLNRSN